MRQVLKPTLGVALIIAAIAAYGPAVASASAPNGTLTASEYARLSASIAGVKRSVDGNHISWSAAATACRRTGSGTALLRTQRVECLAGLTMLRALTAVPHEVAKCDQTTTTATTTTTTGSGSFNPAPLVCMNPDYQGLARDATKLYASDVAARKQALQRGFAGACLDTLASTPYQLKQGKSFEVATRSLAADIALLTKIALGRAPASDLNVKQIDTDATAFERDTKAVLDQNGPDKLSACSHQ